MTGNDNVLKLECVKKDISVYELCIQMLNVLIHFLRKEKDEIPPRIKFPTIVILMSIIVDRGSNLSAQIAHWSPPAMAPNSMSPRAQLLVIMHPVLQYSTLNLYTVLIKGTMRANYIVKRVI